MGSLRCKKKGADLRMHVSPELLHKSALTKATEKEIGLVAKRNTVSFTSSHSDERFMQDVTLFKDGSHLNDKGVRMFTEIAIYRIIRK